MPFCLGNYPIGTQIGSGGPGAAVTSVAVAYMSPSGVCAEGEVLVYTAQEVDQNTASPFRLSVADGAVVSGLIIAVWVAAFIWRALIRVLSSDADSTN